MLGANIFYSQYNILFAILSLVIGISSVFLVKDSKDFRGLLFFQLGGLGLLLGTYLGSNEHLLYKIGLNYNFVTFVQMLIILVTSVLWINAASELHNNHPANRESLTLYISLGLTACVYYALIFHNPTMAGYIGAAFAQICLFLLLLSCLLRLAQNRNVGNILLCTAVLMLLGKMIISAYFYKYGWLNLNILNWLWIYVFAAAVVFIRFSQLDAALQKSWNTIDLLNIQMNNMIDSSPFPIMIVKITGDRLLMINTAAAQLFGLSKKEIAYHKLKDFFIDEDNRRHFFELLEKNHEVQDYDLMVCDLINTSPFWLSVSAKTVQYNNEMAIYMAFQDITSRKERESILRQQADKDPLTQAWNRRYFEKLVPEYINESIKKSENFSLLLLDADKFKNINDTYGHKTGDKVLIELAEICRHSLREDDVVARFGGEEFVVFLNKTDADSAQKVAERLRQNIADASVLDDKGNRISFTVSIGVVSSEKTSALDVLLRQVDDAMYLAKTQGRNRTCLYDEQQVHALMSAKQSSAERNVHPVFQNEESEEISLLDNYDNKYL